MHVDLLLPGQKRFTKTFNLYGPINPSASTFTLLGTKCEVMLAKADGRSWPSITALDPSLASNFVAQLAFSAGMSSSLSIVLLPADLIRTGGERGTTGAKDMVLDATNTNSR